MDDALGHPGRQRAPLSLSRVRFMPASADDARDGLLGWVSITLGDALRLDGLALRRTRTGRLAVAFPARTDRAGQRHPYIRPLDDEARRDIEHQVFEALDLEGPGR